MGLDMYLERIHRDVAGYMNSDLSEIKKNNPNLYSKVAPYIHQRGNPQFYQWESLFEEVGYWRKANAIHQWFVENVQNGVDDCGYHEVTKEHLEELLDTAKKVFRSCVLVPGNVKNGQQFKAGKWVDIMEPGKYVCDTSVAEELLPTTSGFFFGKTDYDQWYVEDLDETIKIIDKVISETDFDSYAIYYYSSW